MPVGSGRLCRELVHRFRLWLRRRRSPLLVHAVQMVHRAYAVAERMSIGNGSRDVSLGEQYCLRKTPSLGQVTRQRSRERATCPMSGVGPLAIRLENLLLNTALAGKAQQVSRLLQVAAGHDHGYRPHLM